VEELLKQGYRYADDMVIQCRSPEEAEHGLAKVQAWTATRA